MSNVAAHSSTNGSPANRARNGSFGEISDNDEIVNAPKRRRRSRMSKATRAIIKIARSSQSGEAKRVIGAPHPPLRGTFSPGRRRSVSESPLPPGEGGRRPREGHASRRHLLDLGRNQFERFALQCAQISRPRSPR